MSDENELLFDELYEKTKDCGRVQFIKLLMQKEREIQELKEKVKELSKWDKNKDSRNSRQRIANKNLLKKINELKKQLEKLQEEYIEFQEKASDIQFELRDDRDNYYERLQDKYREQKDFINYLEDEIKIYSNTYMGEMLKELKEILQKYKSIIGVSDEKK